MEPPLWQCAIAVQADPNIFFHCRPVDGATVMATKLVVEIGDAASRAGLSRVGYFIPLNAARWTGIRLVTIYMCVGVKPNEYGRKTSHIRYDGNIISSGRGQTSISQINTFGQQRPQEDTCSEDMCDYYQSSKCLWWRSCRELLVSIQQIFLVGDRTGLVTV